MQKGDLSAHGSMFVEARPVSSSGRKVILLVLTLELLASHAAEAMPLFSTCWCGPTRLRKALAQPAVVPAQAVQPTRRVGGNTPEEHSIPTCMHRSHGCMSTEGHKEPRLLSSHRCSCASCA